ncbi:MAG: MerR family transcriptional regulator [Acidimicrobiales bacterium]
MSAATTPRRASPANAAHVACSHATEGDASELVRIGTVARRLGLSERTLRYYEEVGLISPAQHQPGASRRYCESDIARIARVREMQELLGFNLDDIRAIMGAEDRLNALRDEYRAVTDQSRQRRLIESAYHELTDMREVVVAKVTRLTDFLDELDQRIARHRARLDEPAASAPRGRATASRR